MSDGTRPLTPKLAFLILPRTGPAARQVFDREALFHEPPPGADAAYFRFPDLPRETLLREWIAPVIHELIGAGGDRA